MLKNIWIKPKKLKNSLILGHRGAMGLAPENTMVSINTALSYQVDLIEIDVHLSKDRKLIVIHDEKVDRTTNGTGYIYQLNSKYIKSLDAGIKFNKKFKNEKIPFLEEILDGIKDKNVKLNIEIKNGPIFYPHIEKKLISLIDKYNYYNKIIVSSFDHYVLQKIKTIHPHIHTAILYGSHMINLLSYASQLKVSAIHPHHYWVTPELVQTMHRHNIAVNTWVINNKTDFLRLSHMGVDAIGTNFPNLFYNRKND